MKDRSSRESLTRLFDALSDPHRRDALYSLKASAKPVALADLATDIAEQETKRTDGELPADKRKQVRTALRHNHIPRLVDAGLVEYDPEKRTVEYRSGSRADEWLEQAADEEQG